MTIAIENNADLQAWVFPYLDNAINNLQPVTDNLVYFFAAVSFVFLALKFVTATEETMAQSLRWLAPDLLTMVSLVWLSTNIDSFAAVIHLSLQKAGYITAGFDPNNTPLFAPSSIWELVWELFGVMTASCSMMSWANPLVVLGAGLALLVLLAAGTVLFLYTLVKLMHFKVLVIIGCFLIPPGLLRRTSTMAEDWITLIVNSSLSFFLLAVMLTLPYPYFRDLQELIVLGRKPLSCSMLGFQAIAIQFLAWAVVTISISQSFSKVISKAITLYGSK